MTKIKAIIFDVDGVVFKTHDSQTGNYLWSKNAKNDLGLSSAHFKIIFSKEWDAIIRGKKKFIEHLNEIFMLPEFNEISITSKEFINYWIQNDKSIKNELLNLADDIKLPCYLGTNQEEVRTNHIKKSVSDHFQGVFASYEIGFAKPERGFFLHIENSLSLSADELLLIDDTEDNIKAVKELGWHGYQYSDDIKHLKNYLFYKGILT